MITQTTTFVFQRLGKGRRLQQYTAVGVATALLRRARTAALALSRPDFR